MLALPRRVARLLAPSRVIATPRCPRCSRLPVVFSLVIGWLTPVGAPVLVAVDDTLFRRCGGRVHGAYWAYDGSRTVAPGVKKLSRGTTCVVAAVVVELPFLDRPIALPVLARLWRPGGPTKPTLARELISVLAAARRDRTIDVVADGGYVCTTLRHLPTNVTRTGPLPATPPSTTYIPTWITRRVSAASGADPAPGASGSAPQASLSPPPEPEHVTVTRYGRTRTITVHHRRCLWPGVFRSRPVRVLVIREPRRPLLSDLESLLRAEKA